MAEKPQLTLPVLLWVLFTILRGAWAHSRIHVVPLRLTDEVSGGKMSLCQCCCLCLEPLDLNHRKRKRFEGPSCAKAREVLTSLAGLQVVELILQKSGAFICVTCENSLNQILKYEQKLSILRENIMGKVSKLVEVGGHSSRKRLVSCSTGVAMPSAKSVCTGASVGTGTVASVSTGTGASVSTGTTSDSTAESNISTPVSPSAVVGDEHSSTHTVPDAPTNNTASTQSLVPRTSGTTSPANVEVSYPWNPILNLYCELPQVHIPYSGGVRTYKVNTPSRKRSIKRLVRKSYVSMASALINSPTTSQNIVTKLALKIREEMRTISSQSHDSVLRDSVEEVKQFSWETVRLELVQKMPTLMVLLCQLVGRAVDRYPLVCLLASMILKSRHRHMGLVQRAISVMLYGNGTAKQVG